MKKHKNKTIIAAVMLALFAWAWMSGGSVPDNSTVVTTTMVAEEITTTTTTTIATTATVATTVTTESAAAEATALSEDTSVENTAVTESIELTTSKGNQSVAIQQLDPETGKDRYLTDPVPDGKPLPVEPEQAEISDTAFTVTLSVRCDTILDNMTRLDKEKYELVPDNGEIFPATVVTVYEGESVFNVLLREMKQARIHMEFVNTPIYNSAYIEGINNLYEFDVGELSGWMYKVNDWFPNYGCSRYQLQPGDVVEWIYTCDLGRDIGEYWLGGR